ncbi:hypothetical protein Tco_1406888 [Tanacetum coccineum]
MALSIADQIALDDALVAPADRLKIGKCNLRLSSDVTSKEATLQVVYDHALTNAPSLLLLRETSIITGNFFIILNSIQPGRFRMLPCSLISMLTPRPVHSLYNCKKG